jgi:carbon monoxide dehydrogenase subunit G
MATVERSIEISAPAEKIFAYLAEPVNYLEIWPAMIAITDVTPNPAGGSDFAWTYKMGGLKFGGTSVQTVFEPPAKLAGASQGGIASTITWTLTEQGDATTVRFHGDYAIPGKLLGKLAEPLIVRENAKQAETILANLKAKTEG